METQLHTLSRLLQSDWLSISLVFVSLGHKERVTTVFSGDLKLMCKDKYRLLELVNNIDQVGSNYSIFSVVHNTIISSLVLYIL